MTVPIASSSSASGEHDLSAAIAALTAELDDRPGARDDIHPFLAHLTIGHLRQIAAALAANPLAGLVEIDGDDYTHAEHWTVARYQAGRIGAVERRYFAAVTA